MFVALGFRDLRAKSFGTRFLIQGFLDCFSLSN